MAGRKRKTFVIKRSLWRRGGDGEAKKGFGNTQLLNKQGLMCCLGFEALGCGLTEEMIFERSGPVSVLPCDIPKSYYRRSNSKKGGAAILEAIMANDNNGLTEPEREIAVRAALKKLGWYTVRFID